MYLNPIINGTQIEFEIKRGKFDDEGWISRGNLICPCCGNTTENAVLKKQFTEKITTEKMLAVIEEGISSKGYRLPNSKEKKVSSFHSDKIEKPSKNYQLIIQRQWLFVYGDTKGGAIYFQIVKLFPPNTCK